MMKWISVDDGLPEIEPGCQAFSNNVLVYVDGSYYEGYYDHREQHWESYEWNDVINVTHWMPLPEPPK